jgi:creatinine amidohydrolase
MSAAANGRPVLWSDLKTPDFPAEARERCVVILPIGSTEQHGSHLPVQVDTLLASEVALRTARRVPASTPVLVLPPLWISLAEHHMGMAGSLTLDFATLHAFVRCVVVSLQRQGYRRVLLLNGHGGNISALNTIVDLLAIETSLPVASATYWMVAAAAFGRILTSQDNLLHACEAETSMLMHLRPDLVDASAARTVHAPARGFLEPLGTHRWRPIGHWSCSGVVGTPASASAAKGERLLDAAGEALAAAVSDGSLWPEGSAA